MITFSAAAWEEIHIATRQVETELYRALNKHGIRHHPINPDMLDGEAFPILVEEVGEVAHELTYDGSSGPYGLDKELIQVAAMAVAWVVKNQLIRTGQVPI